jgi:hypothetical protein
MSARAFHVHPGALVSNVDDRSAVLVGSGVMCFGLTVAEARTLSRQLAVAADDVEHQLSKREYVVTRPDAREFFESEQCPSDRTFR